MKNEREITITLDKPVTSKVKETEGLVIENVTYTPEVEIRGNYFSRDSYPRILVSTRRKVTIEEQHLLPYANERYPDRRRGPKLVRVGHGT